MFDNCKFNRCGQAIALGPFLTLIGFGPFVLTVVIAAVTGAHLLVGWGTTFHVLLTFWLIAARPLAIEVEPHVLRRAAFASVAVQLALFALTITHGGRLPNFNPTRHAVAAPTPAPLAEAVRAAWARHCAAPLRFVVTDGPTGAALAVRYQGHPRAVDITRPEFARFFPDDVRFADGAVVVVRAPTVAAASGLPQRPTDELVSQAAWQTKVELLASDGRQHEYLMGILKPATGEGCEY